MTTRTSLGLLWVGLVCSALFAADIPDNYQDLKFGADSSVLIARYPVSDGYKAKLSRAFSDSARHVTVYRVILVKGAIDSVHYYFLDNRFAFAREYYYPGREYFDQAVRATAGRFGQFVGQGSVFWRRSNGRLVRIGQIAQTAIATVSYLDEKLSGELQERLGYGVTQAEQVINQEIQRLDGELKALDR